MNAQSRKLAARFGGTTALLYGIERGCARLHLPIRVRAYILMAQPVAASPRLSPDRVKHFAVRFLNEGDSALERMPLSNAVLASRFEQGAECLGLFHGSELAAYLWLCRGVYEEDEVRCRFLPEPAERTAWDFDVYVMPAYRASFAFSALWDAADTYLRQQGVQWSLSRISAFNITSVSSHEALGAQEVGRATFLTIGRLQLSKASLSPHCNISLSPRTRPVIRVQAPTRQRQA